MTNQNQNKNINKILLKTISEMPYRIDYKKFNCCVVEPYDYANNIEEIKEIYNTLKNEKNIEEIHLIINNKNIHLTLDDENLDKRIEMIELLK